MELVYRYLTGPRIRHRVAAIIEKFSDMQSDLDRERNAMPRLWAKREAQIHGVIESTVGMYGDLQGIAGQRPFRKSKASLFRSWKPKEPRTTPRPPADFPVDYPGPASR
jgi:hypothetical protein